MGINNGILVLLKENDANQTKSAVQLMSPFYFINNELRWTKLVQQIKQYTHKSE